MHWSNWKISAAVFLGVGLATLLVALVLTMITRKMLGCENVCDTVNDCKKCADAATQRRVGSIMAIVGACITTVGVVLMFQDWRYQRHANPPQIAYSGTMKPVLQPGDLQRMIARPASRSAASRPAAGKKSSKASSKKSSTASASQVPPEYYGTTQWVSSDNFNPSSTKDLGRMRTESFLAQHAKKMADRREKRKAATSTAKGSKKGSKKEPIGVVSDHGYIYNPKPLESPGAEIFKRPRRAADEFDDSESEFDRYRRNVGAARIANKDIGDTEREMKKREAEVDAEAAAEEIRAARNQSNGDDGDDGEATGGGGPAEGDLDGSYDPEVDQSTTPYKVRKGAIGHNARADWKVKVNRAYENWVKGPEGSSYPDGPERQKAYIKSTDRKYPIPAHWPERLQQAAAEIGMARMKL